MLAFAKFRSGGKIQIDCYLSEFREYGYFGLGHHDMNPKYLLLFEMKNFTSEKALGYLKKRLHSSKIEISSNSKGSEPYKSH